jgi:hypothetical protein
LAQALLDVLPLLVFVMQRFLPFLLSFGPLVGLAQVPLAQNAGPDYPVQPVPFTQVHVQSAFWSPRLDTNRRVTIPFAFYKCEETGRIDNFAIAGKLKTGKFKGLRYDDSDVFKVIEGAAYTLAQHPDPKLDDYLDKLIAKIAAAQEPDGYLYTIRTTLGDQVPETSGKVRWANLADSHELYNVGHLYEAAAAHYQATGKRTLLDVALKNADFLVNTFGEGKRIAVPGHQEIELGLAKLYRLTGQRAYLELAKFFLDQRGRHDQRKPYGFPWFNDGDPSYAQDHLPVLQQREAVGHVVRANYMYAGMADVAALTGETAYIAAIKTLWADVAERKLYITGGVGASIRGENYGDAYELPNYSAYNETCAAIALVLWNQRLFLLTGDAKYLDLVERALYNGVLSGVAQAGNKFFYPNPLASDGHAKFNHGFATRAPWFQTSCCPTNMARFLPSLPGYVYAQKSEQIFVNQYIAGTAQLTVPAGQLTLEQANNYPWDGKIELALMPTKPQVLELRLRLPGWAVGQPVPGQLYHYLDNIKEKIDIKINGKPATYTTDQGFAVLRRTWKAGDKVTLVLPMPVRRAVAAEQVEAARAEVALERGPLVYCLEAADNGGSVASLHLPDTAQVKAAFVPQLLGGITALRGRGFTAVPYHLWAHRGEGEMRVWVPRQAPAEQYLLTYFKADDESVYLATSPDGFRWQAVNQGRPILPQGTLGGQKYLLRDPYVRRGPDGYFHLVATQDWRGQQLVHARSRDLRQWDSLQLLPVMAGVPGAVNVWAPEFVPDPQTGEYLLYFSAATQGEKNFDDAHHRTWAVRTRDWRTFTPAQVLYDPGFSQIDATIVPLGGKFYLFSKDERGISTERNRQKAMRLAVASQLAGPYGKPTDLLTPHATEGPMVWRRGNLFYMYYDFYLDGKWGLSVSDNLRDWQPAIEPFALPTGARHGSIFALPQAEWAQLKAANGW